jgi:hypothetical protein
MREQHFISEHHASLLHAEVDQTTNVQSQSFRTLKVASHVSSVAPAPRVKFVWRATFSRCPILPRPLLVYPRTDLKSDVYRVIHQYYIKTKSQLADSPCEQNPDQNNLVRTNWIYE